jgi:nucleoid-associated protein YgaU
MYMFFNKICFINRYGKKASIAVLMCLLFCLPVFAAAGNELVPETDSSQISAQPQKTTESAVVVSTEAPAAAVPVVVMPVSPKEQEAQIKPVPEEAAAQQHQVHTVWLWQESRDCLWNLSKKYYNDPWQWKRIYLANKEQIKDPRKIFPKQVLVIPPAEEAQQK